MDGYARDAGPLDANPAYARGGNWAEEGRRYWGRGQGWEARRGGSPRYGRTERGYGRGADRSFRGYGAQGGYAADYTGNYPGPSYGGGYGGERYGYGGRMRRARREYGGPFTGPARAVDRPGRSVRRYGAEYGRGGRGGGYGRNG